MSDGWLGFVGGTLAALVAGLIASVVQREAEYRRKREQTRLDVYFLLLDLHNWYFWVASAEVSGEHPSGEALAKCRSLTFQLNDKLRAFEDVEHLEKILIILFSESMPSANERANRLSELLDDYGKLVNPEYKSVMQRISRENILRHTSAKAPSSNAPGSWNYRK